MRASSPTSKQLLWGIAFFAAVAVPILVGRAIPMDRTTVEIVQGALALIGAVLVWWIGITALDHSTTTTTTTTTTTASTGRKKNLSKSFEEGARGRNLHATSEKFLPRDSSRPLWVALVVLALLSAASFVRFGHFHHPRFLHNWDLYHYFLGARYFDELGYDDLYRCTLEADEELGGRLSDVRRVRDLRTLGYTTRSRLLRQEPPCRDGFTESRWESFKRDLRFFESIASRRLFRSMLQDKGYNGTPAWTAYVRVLTEWSGTDRGRLHAICVLDEVLLVVALLAVLWAFGPRVFLVAVVFAGLNYATRFQHLGGSLLRLDWLASLTIALCCVKKERWALAGVLVAHATMARLFPLLFVTGLLFRVVWVVITERRLEQRYVRFGAGLAAGLVALGLLGAAGERGPRAWSEFVSNIVPHASAPATKRVGLKYVILPFGGAPRPDEARGQTVNDAMRERWSRRQPLALAVAALALALMFVGSRRGLEDVELFALGVVPVFLLLSPTRYYWGMLLVPVVVWAVMRHRWQREVLVLTMVMQAVLYALGASRRLGLTSDDIGDATLSTVASWCLLSIFGYVLWSISRDELRGWWRAGKAPPKDAGAVDSGGS